MSSRLPLVAPDNSLKSIGALDLYLIRHAESEANTHPEYISGRSTHTPLTAQGREQAQKLGERLRRESIRFTCTLASPTVRTRETAQLALGQDYLFPLTIDDRLQELDQGAWVGQKRIDIYTPRVHARIACDPWNFAAPGGESQRQVEERMLAVVTPHLTHTHNETLAFFTHGVAIKCLLRGILDFDPKHTWRIHIENTSLTHLRYTQGAWWLQGINDYGHLKK